MGTAIERSEAEIDLVSKLSSYAMRAEAVDGMDVLAIEAMGRELVDHVRERQKPAFLEAKTYRFRAHSMYDPQLYRSKDEVAEWEQKGPIIGLTSKLKAAGLMKEEDFLRLQRVANEEVDAAVQFAEQSPLEPLDQLTRFIYAEVAT
jgi:TPP-dependent pyruvate/acetoin dehydrogenase alpha subunit